MNLNEDYGLLDLRYLASYFNEVLGSNFRVVLNSLVYPDRNGKVVVTLQAQRVPFAISNVKSETLTVNLNFRLLESKKNEVVADISKILGCQNFTLDTYKEADNGEAVKHKTFNVTSYLDMRMPIGDPQVDTGEFMVDYQVGGTILVSELEGGAVISNNIKTTLNGVVLPVVSVQANLDKSVEAYQSVGMIKTQPLVCAKSTSYSVSVLLMDNENDKQLIRLIENPEAELVLAFQREYPNGLTISKNVIVVSGAIVEQAGAYAQYNLVLQEVV